MSIQNSYYLGIKNIVKKQVISNSCHLLLSDSNFKKLNGYSRNSLTFKRYNSSTFKIKNNIIPNENKPFMFEAGKFYIIIYIN